MDPNEANKMRPMKEFSFGTELKNLKDLCTELANHERFCEEKLNTIKHLHEKMLEMMKDHVEPTGEGMDQHADGETEELTILRQLQLLIEKKRSLEEKHQRLEQAILTFKERFETILS